MKNLEIEKEKQFLLDDVGFCLNDSGFYFYVPLRLVWESLKNEGKIIEVKNDNC